MKHKVMLNIDDDVLKSVDFSCKKLGLGSRSAYINKILKEYHKPEQKINYFKVAEEKLEKAFGR